MDIVARQTQKRPTLLCCAHLSWDNVWQRPQQLMSRFAERCRVIYVDPPQIDSPGESPSKRSELQVRPSSCGVLVLRPILPQWTSSSLQSKLRELQQLTLTLLDQAGADPIMWVFSPMHGLIAQSARPRLRMLVYDCMDDFHSIKDDPESIGMQRQEQYLLKIADLVFTAGPSLYEARKARHPRIHCFPCGIDMAHFGRALDSATQTPAALEQIPHPRLGYFGALDDRIDWPLVLAVAERRPDWHWVFIGPKGPAMRDPLPLAPNIHYLGQQPYQDLPAYLKGFDLCTMPFAHNALTQFISPTKTLEYLAGSKQVVSSSVRDVVERYSDIVEIADGVDGWLTAIGSTLGEPAVLQQARLERAQPIFASSSWDSIVERMWRLIEDRLEGV